MLLKRYTIWYLFGLLCIVQSHSLLSQNLVKSRRSSYSTFIYKISNEEAFSLYADLNEIDKSYFHTYFDSFPSDSSYNRELPIGHYLFVNTIGGEINYRLESSNNLFPKILNNHRDLMVRFYDLGHTEIKPGNVSLRNKSIKYDEISRSYRLNKTNREGILMAEYKGHQTYFPLERRYNNTLAARSWRTVQAFPPVRIVLSPFKYVYRNIGSITRGGRVFPPGIYHKLRDKIWELQDSQKNGYMVFNKPKYRPGDTVRFKAFLIRKNGRPLSKKLNVYINRNYRVDNPERMLYEIKPLRKGAYTGEFILHDSLELKLDQSYTLSLRTGKWNTQYSNPFIYEAYDLNDVTFTASVKDSESGNDRIIVLNGKDSNGNPVFDASYQVTLLPEKYLDFYTPSEFIPDTLWTHQNSLLSGMPTEVTIPDSLFGEYHLGYSAHVEFLSATRERTETKLDLVHDAKFFPYKVELISNSLEITKIGEHGLDNVDLEIRHDNEEVVLRKIQLPFQFQVNGLIERIVVNDGLERKTFPMNEFDSKLGFNAVRTADSISISSINPRGLEFNYFIFRNNKLIEEGFTNDLLYHNSSNTRGYFYLSVQYLWAGEMHSEEYMISLQKNELKIELIHEKRLVPGEESQLEVHVKDYKGNPIGGVDLTAYGISSKFKQPLPRLMSFSKSKDRKAFNSFDESTDYRKITEQLDFDYWREELGLDSIEYYRFLYPKDGIYSRFIQDSSLQDGLVLPFVIDSGKIIQVHLVTIDGFPYYFHGSETINPYCLGVINGFKTLFLRTHDMEIKVDSVEFREGYRHILSVDIHKNLRRVNTNARPEFLLENERRRIKLHFSLFAYDRRGKYFLEQQGKFFIPDTPNYGYRRNFYAGPFNAGLTGMTNKDGDKLQFDYFPGYNYSFAYNSVILQEQEEYPFQLYEKLSDSFQSPDFTAKPTAEKDIEYFFEKDREQRLLRYPARLIESRRSGRLELDVYPQFARRVVASYLINLSQPEKSHLFNSMVPPGSYFEGGNYFIALIREDGSHITLDSIGIKSYGYNYHFADTLNVHPPDSLSNAIIKLMKNWSNQSNYNTLDRNQQMHRIRSGYANFSSTPRPGFSEKYFGYVVDESGLTLPGVNVLIRGTRYGTVSDLNGYYELYGPPNATLVFSFIGMMSQEITARRGYNTDLVMEADVQQLSEVVVVAYGVSFERALAGSVAGVAVSGVQGTSDISLRIRGVSSISGDSQPLFIVDGVPVGKMELNPDDIKSLEIIQGPEATTLYGSQAANGVVIISTQIEYSGTELRKVAQQTLLSAVPAVANRIRTNFKDDAFWAPNLVSDQNGKASVSFTLPDDITGWNLHVLGMKRKKTGTAKGYITSFKPLMASLETPKFLIEGDSSHVIGTITNFSGSSATLSTNYKINKELNSTEDVEIENSETRELALPGLDIDTLEVEYSLQYGDYHDGETRHIPVLQKGAEDSKGLFLAISSDTSFTFKPVEGLGAVTLFVESNPSNVLKKSAEWLSKYRYGCNEQLASRLIALLYMKMYNEQHDIKFREDGKIKKLISEIGKNQQESGGWSWWGNSGSEEVWVTRHIQKAINLASDIGFNIPVERENILDFYYSKLPYSDYSEKLQLWDALLSAGEQIQMDFQPSNKMTDRILSQKLKFQLGDSINTDFLDSTAISTFYGSTYWKSSNLTFIDSDSKAVTLQAYELYKTVNPDTSLLQSITDYFLRQKSYNTYHIGSLLLSIGIDQLENQIQNEDLSFKINNREIEDFGEEVTLNQDTVIHISKSGHGKVYFSASQTYWNRDTNPLVDPFELKTNLPNDTLLTAGKPIDLEVKVIADKEYEYVMLNIPIPAGCDYRVKNQSYRQQEVYREYDYHQTNIFLRRISPGSHTFTISLLPRFSGRYHINPGRVSLMYYPTFQGRNGMQMVRIGK